MQHHTEDDSIPLDIFAFYLPQFYPMELNSRWWGEGYTEWNAVVAAQRGCRSPRSTTLTPGELGFYDLRNRNVRMQQGRLAASASIAALCIYHYWSAGERLLSEVEDLIVEDGAPDHPFFLCWANHDWTLAWKGQPNARIWVQDYDEHLNDHHIEWLLKVFEDPRYYKIDGSPVLAIYKPLDIESRETVLQHWRTVVKDRGFPGIVLIGMCDRTETEQASTFGFDSWVQTVGTAFDGSTRMKIVRSALRSPAALLRYLRWRDHKKSTSALYRSLEEWRRATPIRAIPLVIPSWNNAGRAMRGAWYIEPDIGLFREALKSAINDCSPLTVGTSRRRLVAINAWNEWGENMTLEPSVEFGDGFLRAVSDAVSKEVASD